MTRIFPFFALLLLATPAHADRASALARAEKYLSGIKTIVADFSQIGADGSEADGKFYLKRPNKMRWQYNPPTPILMVTRGSFLTYYDYELNQVSDIPLDSTLLGFLSRKSIDFDDPAIKVTDVTESGGALQISLTQKDSPEDGALTLEFSDQPLQLRNFIIKDATGQTTHVSLANARFDTDIADSVFAFEDPRVGGTRRQTGGSKLLLNKR